MDVENQAKVNSGGPVASSVMVGVENLKCPSLSLALRVQPSRGSINKARRAAWSG